MSAPAAEAPSRARVEGSSGWDAAARPAALLLVVMCAASLAVVVILGTRLTFFNDDWYFLLQRPGLESHGGLDVLLAPHNSNCVVLTALAYKVLVAVFGLSSQVPFRLVLGLVLVAVAVLLYLLVSARAGRVLGLACAAVVLFLGAAWEDLLFFGASIDVAGSGAAGLGALWALERETPRRNVLACLLLVAAVGFSNIGVPFAAAAAVLVLLRRRPSQLWVAAVPLILFGIWWIADGSTEPSHLSGANIRHLPRYVLDSASAGLASVTGLSRGTVPSTYTPGHVELAVAAAVLIVALATGWRPRVTVLVPLAAALAFWILTGASFIPGREPFASRYQLIDAVLLLLIAAELLRGIRVPAPAALAVVAAAAAVVWSNVDRGLTDGYQFLREQSAFAKADLGALELGRGLAPPNLWLIAGIAHNPYLSGVTAGQFFAETRAHGRVPTYSARQLAAAPAPQRQGADSVLAHAERIPPTISPAQPAAAPDKCFRLANSGAEVPLGPGAWTLTDEGRAGLAIGVRRFAPAGLASLIGPIAPGLAERLVIPQDTIGLPWRLSIEEPPSSPAPALRLCRA